MCCRLMRVVESLEHAGANDAELPLLPRVLRRPLSFFQHGSRESTSGPSSWRGGQLPVGDRAASQMTGHNARCVFIPAAEKACPPKSAAPSNGLRLKRMNASRPHRSVAARMSPSVLS